MVRVMLISEKKRSTSVRNAKKSLKINFYSKLIFLNTLVLNLLSVKSVMLLLLFVHVSLDTRNDIEAIHVIKVTVNLSPILGLN